MELLTVAKMPKAIEGTAHKTVALAEDGKENASTEIKESCK
jgi:hypothetical protein